ncbi:NB-ARC domain-containing protein [Frankia sp. AgB32]|nr:NB-ARC domain-containing protein [Frankia sp. AgB32]
MAAYPPNQSFVDTAIQAVLKAESQPLDMEHFAARSEDPAAYCQRRVRECDIYVGLIGLRYGSMVPGDDVSFTELEFRTASTAGMPRLLFLLDDTTPHPPILVDADRTRIEQFRENLRRSGVIVKTFSSCADLGAAVFHALVTLDPANPGRAGQAGARPPRMVPALLGPVVDRPGISAELLGRLTAPGSGPVELVTGLEGAGGVGKTTLAALVCRRPEVEDRYPGGTLWVALGEQARGAELARIIALLCAELSDTKVTSADPVIAGDVLGKLLDERPPTLIVIDDVWYGDQLAPFLLGGDRSGRLVTTRNVGVVPRYSDSIQVDQMTLAEARQALTARVSGMREQTQDRLATITGRWPVLLGLVNAALVDHLADGATAEQAADWIYGRLKADGPTALDVEDADSRDQAVAATVLASLEMLTPDERDRYRDLAIFPEDVDIPLDALEVLWEGTGGLDTRAVLRLRTRLVRLRLLVGHWAANRPAVRVHDVLRSYLRHQLGPAGLTARHGVFIAHARSLLPVHSASTAMPPWWSLPATSDYLWRTLPYHLREANLPDHHADLVTDLRWIEGKITHTGTTVSAEADLALVNSAIARMLRRTLGQSAHLLTTISPQTSLGPTLASRLDRLPGLEATLAAYQRHLPGRTLRPVWPLSDTPDPACLRALTGHGSWVHDSSLSPDGRLLATASLDGTVRTWNVLTGQPQAILPDHSGGAWACAIAPDGKVLATGSGDGTVRLWDLTSPQPTDTLTGHTGTVTSCAFSPDGRLLATASLDRTVRLWDLPGGQHIATLRGHTGAVRACAFSPTGRLLATASADATVGLWNPATAEQTASLTGHVGSVWSCAFSPDGRQLATAGNDGTVRRWTVTGRTTAILTADSKAHHCAYSPDGKSIASTHRDGTVRLWNTFTGEPLAIFAGHTDSVWSCTYSPDGTFLASTGEDGTIRIWDTGAGVPSTTYVTTGRTSGMRHCAISADGTLLAGSCDDGTIALWTSSGRLERTWAGHNVKSWCCAFSPSGQHLVTAGGDGTTRIWNTHDGSLHRHGTRHQGPVYSCAISPDGTLLATAGDDARIQLSRIGSEQRPLHLTGHRGAVWACSFSPDGDRIASAGNDGNIRFWDTTTGAPQSTLTGHVGAVWSCVFAPDGTRMASVGNDGTLRLWDLLADESEIIHGQPGWFRSCAFSADGELISSVGDDGIIRIWETASRSCIGALRTAQPLSACRWHPNDRLLAAAGDGGFYLFGYGGS